GQEHCKNRGAKRSAHFSLHQPKSPDNRCMRMVAIIWGAQKSRRVAKLTSQVVLSLGRSVPSNAGRLTADDVRFGSIADMSGTLGLCPLPPRKRTSASRPRHVRFVPEADIR